MGHEILILGVLVSLVVSELTDLSPGGIITAGYVVLYIETPWRIGYTVVLAVAVFLVMELLSRVVILFGRRWFALAIVLTYLVHTFGVSVIPALSGFNPVGILIPGIMAREFKKQGMGITLCIMAITAGLLLLVMMLVGWL